MTRRHASAVSEHPLASHAVGEVAGRLLDTVGPAPDLAVVFVSGDHAGAFEDVVGAIRQTLEPGVLVGCTAQSVLADAIEIEDRAAVAVWAGRTGQASPVRLRTEQRDDGTAVSGFGELMTEGEGTLLLLADPFTTPTQGLIRRFGETIPDVVVIGGLASGARGPGGNRLVLDDLVVTDGAVGVLLPPGVVEPVVSQGCRPIGSPYIVTAADGNVVLELGGTPAIERLEEELRGIDPDEQALAAQGLHVGLVVDESKATFNAGDFLIRNLVGADRERGGLAIGAVAEVGQTLQFHVRDAATASTDLLTTLAEGPSSGSAIVFSCNGRGSSLFGPVDHDARTIHQHLGGPVAGMFCAGEIGPVGGRNHLHGFTTCLAVFADD